MYFIGIVGFYLSLRFNLLNTLTVETIFLILNITTLGRGLIVINSIANIAIIFGCISIRVIFEISITMVEGRYIMVNIIIIEFIQNTAAIVVAFIL